MKIDTSVILTALKADFESAKSLRRQQDAKISKWKREYNGELYGHEKPNSRRSKMVSRDIKKQSEWQHAALIEPFVSTPDIIRARPVTYEDAEIAPKLEVLLNTQFCRMFDRYNFMNKAIKVLDQEGTCVVRTGWDYREDTIKEQVFDEVPNPELEQLSMTMQELATGIEQMTQAIVQIEQQYGIPNEAEIEQATNQMGTALKAEGMISDEQIQSRLEQYQAQMMQEVQNNVPSDVLGQYGQLKQQVSALQEQLGQLEEQANQLPPTVEVPRIIEITKPVVNRPTAMICRNEDIFLDPTCQDNMDNCQFVIYRYESDMTTLKREGIYKNLNKIIFANTEYDYVSPDETRFEFRDNPRKKLIVHEYWGNYDVNGDGEAEAIVCTWVNDVVIRLETNPFPDKKPPFIVVPFNSVPFSMYGESNAELLSDIQKIKTAIYRGFIDNMALSNNGQKGIKQGMLSPEDRIKFLNGDNFEYLNGSPNDIFDGHFNEFPSSAFNFISMLSNEAESITGVKVFGQGMAGNSLGSTATAAQGVIDSANTRRLNIVRNIAENLVKPLLRKWLAYDAEWLDEESQYRITNDEFVWIKRDDLGARIDIDLSISTSDDNKATANELTMLLQTLGPNSDPQVTKIILSQICELFRQPELAKKVRDYEPQPDPLQQRLQMAQIELVEAQVENERSKAERAGEDSALKQAKTKSELAKARNIESQADKTDLDYLQQYHGTQDRAKMEHERQMKEMDLSADKQANIMRMIENITKAKKV